MKMTPWQCVSRGCSQGETYTLFQDKVDEAEARLEVATESSNLCKRR